MLRDVVIVMVVVMVVIVVRVVVLVTASVVVLRRVSVRSSDVAWVVVPVTVLAIVRVVVVVVGTVVVGVAEEVADRRARPPGVRSVSRVHVTARVTVVSVRVPSVARQARRDEAQQHERDDARRWTRTTHGGAPV